MLLLSSHKHIIYIKPNLNFKNIVILSESEEKRRYLIQCTRRVYHSPRPINKIGQSHFMSTC